MIRTGLLSITFRQLTPEEIIDLAVQAGVEGLEWGGDIHVPHGDLDRAKEVGLMTAKAGLKVAAYGSYYRVGVESPVPFSEIVHTAVQLGAPTIRVWAGNKGSDASDEQWRETVVKESRTIADLAERAGLTVSFEYHGNTLTDTNESALKLLQEVNHPNIRTLWQPPVDQDFHARLQGLEQVSPWLTNVHVFHWLIKERRPLAEGAQDWNRYLSYVNSLPGDRYAMLEFVKDDSPAQFLADAEALKGIIEGL